MKLLVILFLVSLWVVGPSGRIQAQNQADVFFHPEQGFLRVETALQVQPDGPTVDFELFPEAQVTAIWTPGMQGYALDRRPSMTRVTVTLREIPEAPQTVEIAYEGFLSPSVVEAGVLEEGALWFPRFDPALDLEQLTVRFPAESNATLEGDWHPGEFSPTERIYIREEIDHSKAIRFSADPSSSVTDPVVVDSQDAPQPPTEPDFAPEADSPESDVDTDTSQESALELPPAPPVPLSDRERHVRQAWTEHQDPKNWSHWLAPELQEPEKLESLAVFVGSLEWPEEAWNTRRPEVDRAISTIESVTGTRTLRWRLEWLFDGAEWLVTGLTTKPLPTEITDHRLPLFREWLERWQHEPWLNHAFWWSDIFSDSDLENGMTRFLRSLDGETWIDLLDLSFSSSTEGTLTLWVESEMDAFLVEVTLVGEEQSWVFVEYQITPW